MFKARSFASERFLIVLEFSEVSKRFYQRKNTN